MKIANKIKIYQLFTNYVTKNDRKIPNKFSKIPKSRPDISTYPHFHDHLFSYANDSSWVKKSSKKRHESRLWVSNMFLFYAKHISSVITSTIRHISSIRCAQSFYFCEIKKSVNFFECCWRTKMKMNDNFFDT